MNVPTDHSPWLCHVCDYTSRGEPSTACALCFKTTCSSHLRRISHYNRESGLYEIQAVCIHCTIAGGLG